MKNKIEISVILPVYNASNFVEESILSILRQTYINFELIIINDGSFDDTLKICENLKTRDNRIKLINQSHKGLTKSLNAGIKISKGNFIARQDADDLSLKTRFEEQLFWFKQNKQRVLCGTNTLIKDTYGYEKKNKIISFRHKDIIKKFEYTNCIAHSSAMFSKYAAEKVGLYDENLFYSQDYDLWWKLSTIGEVGNLSKKLVLLNERESSISFQKSNSQIKDFIKSSLKFYAVKNNINQSNIFTKFEDLDSSTIIQSQKKILEFLYNDKIDKKIKFGNLNLLEKIISFKFIFLYLRKIKRYLTK